MPLRLRVFGFYDAHLTIILFSLQTIFFNHFLETNVSRERRLGRNHPPVNRLCIEFRILYCIIITDINIMLLYYCSTPSSIILIVLWPGVRDVIFFAVRT